MYSPLGFCWFYTCSIWSKPCRLTVMLLEGQTDNHTQKWLLEQGCACKNQFWSFLYSPIFSNLWVSLRWPMLDLQNVFQACCSMFGLSEIISKFLPLFEDLFGIVAPPLTLTKTVPKTYQTDTWGLFYSYIWPYMYQMLHISHQY